MKVLPDRERRHLLQFYIAPKMGYRSRLIVAGILIGIGLLLQWLWAGQAQGLIILISLPMLFVGNLFLLVRGYDLRPSAGARHHAEWEKTTRDRFAEVRSLERRVKRWDETFTDVTCVTGFVCLLMVAGAVWLVATAIGAATGQSGTWAMLFICDAAVLILPHWLTGTRRGWRPAALSQQIGALEIAMRTVDRFKDPPCQVQPMFEMAGKGDKRSPHNARVFVRFPDGPEDFLGIQFQVAINNVQGTNYPYLYAVIVAKKPFQLISKHLLQIQRFVESANGPAPSGWQSLLGLDGEGRLLVETSREKDVDVVIIRQKTTKNSGYHTEPPVIRRIAKVTWSVAARLAAQPVAVS